ncbi:MAG: hypothetical protein AAGE90_05565 [Pseudomonadota bacterium]
MPKISHVFLVALAAVSLSSLNAAANPQMRLADELDFPGEGYCIDVLGVGATARTDLPLVVHNCIPGRQTEDRVAVYRDGRIEMPAYDACVTAIGVTAPLPGSAVMLRPCGGHESFLPADALQWFDRTSEGRLRLRGSDLCLTAGPDSAATFSASHRWRTLTMTGCATAPLALSVWD